MFYIEFVTETSERAQIFFMHGMPFDPFEGMQMSEKELLKKGLLVEEIPVADLQPGKEAHLYINPQTKKLWYEYVDVPAPEDKIAQLENANRDLMLATTDLFEQNLVLEEKHKTTMLATTDLFEQNIALEERITSLEGNANESN